MRRLSVALLALSLLASAAHAQIPGAPIQQGGGGGGGGGGGTPGGSSGQVQYNNSGAFGGFTLSGSCTLVTSTGVITCPPPVITSTNPLLEQYTNDPVTGTTVNHVATLSPAQNAIGNTTAQIQNAIGIVSASTQGGATGPGTTGTVNIAFGGQVPCVFDGATVANDFVGISPNIANDCTDLGPAPPPANVAILGVMLSTNGGAGTYNIDLNPLGVTGGASQQAASPPLPFYLGGLTLSNDGVSPNTVIDVAAGAATSSDFAVLATLSAAVTKTTGAFVSGTGNGCLDTGSVANSTWYHVFVITKQNGSNVDVLCSTSASAPNLPPSFKKMRRIGSFKTNGSAQIIAFTQVGSTFWWKVATMDVDTTALSTSQVLETLNVPPGVKVQPLCRYTISNTGNSVILLSLDVTDVAPGTATPFASATPPGWDQLDTTLTAGDQNSACPYLTTNTAQQIGARASAASTTLRLITTGWVD